jgi:hypothetical protein
MPIETYRTAPGLPGQLERDRRETMRFGYDMGRLELGTTDGIDPAELRDLFLDSALDILVVRVPSEGFDWSARLRHPDLAVLSCDALFYFRKDLYETPPAPLEDGWRIATEHDSSRFGVTVGATFDGYRSHYAANPLIDRVAMREGYVEWALSYLHAPPPQMCAWLHENDAGDITSWVTLRLGHSGEIVLGGVVPGHRGNGAFTRALAAGEHYFAEYGLADAYVASPSTNGTVIRNCILTGYQFETAFSTLHLVKGRALLDLDQLTFAHPRRAVRVG